MTRDFRDAYPMWLPPADVRAIRAEIARRERDASDGVWDDDSGYCGEHESFDCGCIRDEEPANGD